MPASRRQWQIPFAVQLIPGGLLLAGAFWLKESPRWLYSKGRRDEGLKNLCWIRKLESNDIYMVEEVAAIDAAIEHQASTMGMGFFAPFKAVAKDRAVQWRFLLGGKHFLKQKQKRIPLIKLPRFALHVAERQWYQRNQLLLPHRLQVHRYHWYQHWFLHNWSLRCRKDCPHNHLAFVPHRQTW
jgi:hypothetical protein